MPDLSAGSVAQGLPTKASGILSKLTNVSGRDLLVNSRRVRGSRDRVGGVVVKAGQVYDVVKEAVDVGDAYQVGDRLYPKRQWSLVKPAPKPVVKQETSGKADGAEPVNEKE